MPARRTGRALNSGATAGWQALSIRSGKGTAILIISHHRGIQNIVAGRFGSTVDPVEPVSQCTTGFIRGEVTVARCPDRSLHQQVGVAITYGAFTVKLLVTERHIEVAQRMHGQHRHIKITVDFRQPAHTIVAAGVNTCGSSFAWHYLVESQLFSGRLGTVCPAVYAATVVINVAIEDAADGAVVAATGHHGVLVLGTETVLKNRTLAAGQVHRHQ